ncbi:sugar baby transporter isoform X2 [Leptinotarsa decemlineata]|uniref:sugar baby transporter isoform X2 n=1 Tax=Leptinotarsa decemlineata TaxID=7539 RepID=UPI003D30969E
MVKSVVNKQLLPMKAHYFLWNAGTGPVVPFLSSYARQLGFSSVVVGFVYTILPISGMLAKPFFGSIADRFHCQKILFLIAQLLTAVAFLSIFYAPKIDVDRRVHFACHENLAVFDTNSTDSVNDCSMPQLRKDKTMDKCEMNCDMKENITDILCKDWKLSQFCQADHPDTFSFTANVPKSEIDLLGSKLIFRVPNVTLPDGRVLQPGCPISRSISTSCQVNCGDYDMNDLIAVTEIKDSVVYSLHHFWIFLFLMVLAWIGQAVSVSIGDAICFELLGDRPDKYGYQRMFGSLGWGIVSAVAGLLIDALSSGKSQKDYTVAFYLSAIFLVLDFLASTRIQYTQTKLATNIFRDIGRLLLNIRINIYLIWCVCVGMCTGLIWQFLFWLIEDLAKIQGCETINYVKTLEGIVQAIQCLAGEAPFFFLSGKIIKKLGHIHTMSLVLFAVGMRFILYSVVSNPWYFLPIELMNGITFGLFFACMASYASIIAPAGTEATMQGLVGAVFEGVGVSLGSLLAGWTYKNLGGPLTFRYFGYGAFVACVLHVAVQYLLSLKDSREQYSPPKVALEKVHYDDQQELTYVDT